MPIGRSCALALLLPACVMVDPPVAEELAPDTAMIAGERIALAPSLQAVYVIEEGDTLATIARRFAVPGGWRALAAANGVLDADHIEASHGLIIPTEGLLTWGRDPFSLYDDVDLIPRQPPLVLDEPPPPVAGIDDFDRSRGADTADGCGGHHQHLELDPEHVDDPDVPHCVPVGRHTLCVGDAPVRAADDPDDAPDGDDEVEVTVDGAPWLRLPYSFMEPLEIVEVDLDGDGDDELILAELEAISNGICISTYGMVIADGPGAAAHRYTTNSWSLVDAGAGCVIEHGSFESIDDPVDGGGNYDVTRDLIWRDGALATRGAGVRADRLSAQPPQLRVEPLLAGQVLTRRTGTVVAFDDSPTGHRALTLAIGPARVVLAERTWRWSDDDDDPDPELQYVGLGLAGSPVLLPDDYRPPAATLLGRDATLETRLTLPLGDLTQVVWLAPR